MNKRRAQLELADELRRLRPRLRQTKEMRKASSGGFAAISASLTSPQTREIRLPRPPLARRDSECYWVGLIATLTTRYRKVSACVRRHWVSARQSPLEPTLRRAPDSWRLPSVSI